MPSRRAISLILITLTMIPIGSLLAASPPRPGDLDASLTPRFGHHKEQTCAQKAHERVRAVMDGKPSTRLGTAPSATNHDCR